MGKTMQLGNWYSDPKEFRANKHSSKSRKIGWYHNNGKCKGKSWFKKYHHRVKRRELKHLLEDAPRYNTYAGWWW